MISSIGSTSVAQVSSLRAAQTGSVGASTTPSDDTSLSGPAELFKKLKALAQSDPAKFKAAAQDIADTLTDAADQATDPHEKQMLTDLSAKFADAAKTGDASVLEPPKGAPPGGGKGPPPAGGAAGGKTQTFDPADANEDGTVTPVEQAAYDAKQAAKASATSAAGAYGRQMHGAAQEKGQALFSQLNAIVVAASA
jgi:hypothetical protein